MVPVLANLFEAVLARKIQEQIQWHGNIIGFRPGKQVLEVVEPLRILLQRACEWGRPLFVSSVNIAKAFDNIRRQYLDMALASQNVVLELRISLMRELSYRNGLMTL